MKNLNKLYQSIINKTFQIVDKLFFSTNKNDVDILTNKLQGLKLHLGCGHLYKYGWVNIDIDKSLKTDICSDFMSVHENFQKNSVRVVTMIHSISYLNLWEAKLFFRNIYDLLVINGVLELEFPDIDKCAKVLSNTKSTDKYIEAVRGIYAFDLNQINNQETFKSYSFGWSAWYIKLELKKAGFKEVRILRPYTHGKLSWRDTRIIAIK